MWTPMDIPIEVSRTGTTPIGLEIYDTVASEPLDLTGVSLVCRVAMALGEEVIAEPYINISSATDGLVDLLFDGDYFDFIDGEQEIIKLVYEVKASYGSDDVTLMRGPLILIPGI